MLIRRPTHPQDLALTFHKLTHRSTTASSTTSMLVRLFTPPTSTGWTSFLLTSIWLEPKLACCRFHNARYILIDCSPSLGLITVNALTAADSVIIPVQCEYFALEGLSKLLNTIRIIKVKLNPQLEIEGFLLTMYDRRLRLANQVYDEVKRHFQELVFKTVIQRNVKLGEAPGHGMPVILYDADSAGARDYLALANELVKQNEKS